MQAVLPAQLILRGEAILLARLVLRLETILLAQLILCLETILLAQLILRLEAILVLLTSLIGACQRRCRDGHDQSDDDEQKRQLFHGFFPFCSGAYGRASARLCPRLL